MDELQHESEKPGVKTTPQSESDNKLKTNKDEMSKSDLAKKVFTDKGTFKEFMQFIGRGFKSKK